MSASHLGASTIFWRIGWLSRKQAANRRRWPWAQWNPVRFALAMLAALSMLAALAGCHRDDDGVSLPALDQRSPEAALKSYWARLDWYGEHYVTGRAEPLEGARQRVQQVLQPLVAPAYLASLNERMPRGLHFEGAIEKRVDQGPDAVEIEAAISNPEAQQASFVPTPVELVAGESGGGRFRYRLVRNGEAWRITELWRLDTGADPVRLR